jgi:hypothetical protein
MPVKTPKARSDSGTSTKGRCLAPAELARLRLVLPLRLPDFLVEQLTKEPLLGAQFEVPVTPEMSALVPKLRLAGVAARQESAVHAETLVLACFDVPRLIAEALDFQPGATLLAQGFLPFAGCGLRGTALYFVALGGREKTLVPGELHFIDASWDSLAPRPLLGRNGSPLRLNELLSIAVNAPQASLRQRLKKKLPSRSRPAVRRRVPVSLSLFD